MATVCIVRCTGISRLAGVQRLDLHTALQAGADSQRDLEQSVFGAKLQPIATGSHRDSELSEPAAERMA